MEVTRTPFEHSPDSSDSRCRYATVGVRSHSWSLLTVAVLTLQATNLIAAGTDPVIQSVSAAPSFFNPSIGQSVAIEFSLAKSGTVDVVVVAPKGDVVRTLLSGRPLGAGSQAISWDGRTESNVVAPNDGYSVRISWSDGQNQEVFDPARSAPKLLNVKEPIYDVSGGLFTYELPYPARITLDASCLSPNPTSAYTKAIVAGEPRVGGPIVEIWNGYDKSGKVFMPDCPGFHTRLEARALPAPALITIGNRATDQEASRKDGGVRTGSAGHTEGRP